MTYFVDNKYKPTYFQVVNTRSKSVPINMYYKSVS